LPPIKNGCELDSLDTASNCKSHEQTIKVRLHGAPGHFQLSGNFRIVATLQQQFGNLLFPRTQPNRAFVHFGFPLGLVIQVDDFRPDCGQLIIEVACARNRRRRPNHSVLPDIF
jgi:hypothetical protein